MGESGTLGESPALIKTISDLGMNQHSSAIGAMNRATYDTLSVTSWREADQQPTFYKES